MIPIINNKRCILNKRTGSLGFGLVTDDEEYGIFGFLATISHEFK